MYDILLIYLILLSRVVVVKANIKPILNSILYCYDKYSETSK